jgi:tRNA1(Val) A37 N6-methylase TrmN6
MDTTLDGLLGRRVTVEQPVDGYRVAVDTVLLAAGVSAKATDRVADFGCGVGGAMLCLAARVSSIAVTGFELQSELANLCRANIARNHLHATLNLIEADVTDAEIGAYDHVMMNPPYHAESRHAVSASHGKRTANAEKNGHLALWIASAVNALKSSGTLTIIHRADRLDEILAAVKEPCGTIEILAIQSKSEMPPKRVILRAYKDGGANVIRSKSLVLHAADGRYTAGAEDILRHAKALPFLSEP